MTKQKITDVTQMTEVFIRKASGLTRVISPWDALAYAFMNPGIMYCFLYLIWTIQLYPGVYMPIATIPGVLLMFIPALLYIWFSIAMPRSGGEYIWGSRIISPAWGFCSGWALSMVGMSWAGSCTYWAISFGFNNALRSVAVSEAGAQFANHSLWQLANYIDSLPVMLVVGTLVIISFMAIMWRGARASMILSWIGVVTGILGHVVFWIAVLTSGGQAAFIQNFNAMSGTTYEAVLSTAKATGWPVGTYDMGVTVTGGITYVALNTLGSTYTANIMGEIKEVKKSALLAMLGALVLFLVFWTISYSTFYWAFGGDFWAASIILRSWWRRLRKCGLAFPQHANAILHADVPEPQRCLRSHRLSHVRSMHVRQLYGNGIWTSSKPLRILI